MRLCIIAGGGQLPIDLIKGAERKDIFNCLIIIKSQVNEDDYKFHKNSISLNFGELGKVLKFLSDNEITHIAFAGSVKRPNLFTIFPDFEGAKLLTKILANKFLGDDNLLKTVLKYFEDKGYTILNPNEIVSFNSDEIGCITSTHPKEEDIKNIEVGLKVFEHIAILDIGQSLVVSDGRVVAIEAAEGTDEMLNRAKDYVHNRSVLVKFPKRDQDERVDMPVIGPKTIDMVVKSNINGIAINKNVMIISKEETIKNADKKKIFIYINK